MASRIRESEIERVARAAQERGMSYGRFVSLGLEAPPEETRRATQKAQTIKEESLEAESAWKKCANEHCENLIAAVDYRRKFCCKKCWNEHWYRMKREEKDA